MGTSQVDVVSQLMDMLSALKNTLKNTVFITPASTELSMAPGVDAVAITYVERFSKDIPTLTFKLGLVNTLNIMQRLMDGVADATSVSYSLADRVLTIRISVSPNRLPDALLAIATKSKLDQLMSSGMGVQDAFEQVKAMHASMISKLDQVARDALNAISVAVRVNEVIKAFTSLLNYLDQVNKTLDSKVPDSVEGKPLNDLMAELAQVS